MMDNSYDYWFSKYDSESFEKDFIKVPYNEFLNQLIMNPDFGYLPQEPQLSLDSGHKLLQQTLTTNHQLMSAFFLPLLDTSRDHFLRWVRSVIAYLDCEKMYSIMFWNLGFMNNFLEYRLYASFIRFYKFLISLTQNIVKSDHNRLTIRQSDNLYIKFEELQKLQRSMLKVLKPLVSQNPTLIGKIYYFIYHMYDKQTSQLRKDLDLQFGQLEIQWVKKILNENQMAIKCIDAYLNDDKQQLNKDQFIFEDSEVIKQITSSHKSENLYKIEPQDKNLLEKSKKIQFLNQLDSNCKKRSSKSSAFVQNYSTVSENSLKSNEELQKQNSLSTQQDSQFLQYHSNHPSVMQNSVIGFLASDLLHLEKATKPQSKVSQIQSRIQTDDSMFLKDELVDYISKADSQIAAIRDEDIAIDDNYRKKRYRIKINKRLEENESPEVMRKQTMGNTQQQENNEDELRRIRARRLLEEQNQFYYEKLKNVNNQDNELATVKDKDLFKYSFEDSMSEDEDSDNDHKEQKEAKVIVPKNYSQNTQGIIFEKFKQYSGDHIMNEKKMFFLNRLFHFNENSLRLSGKTLMLDFEERKWVLLQQALLSKKLMKEDNYTLNYDDITNNGLVGRDINFNKQFKNDYSKFYNF